MAIQIKNQSTDELFKAILTLKSVDECYAFFEDLCTVTELRALSQRMAVARLLNDNTVYTEIVAKTGASTATITRDNRSLNYGSDGYKLVIDRLNRSKSDE